MRPFFGPLHLLFFAESFADHFVHRRLHKPGRDRLALTIALTVIRDHVDTVAEMLDSTWTWQVIPFILPAPTVFSRGASDVWTGRIRARPYRGDCRYQGPPSTSTGLL